MQTATAEILVGDRPRYEIQRDIKAKVRLTYRKPTHAARSACVSCLLSTDHATLERLCTWLGGNLSPPSCGVRYQNHQA